MPITGFYHVNVVCTDLDRSKAFYELLGFEEDLELPDGTDEGMVASLALPPGTSGKASVMMLDRTNRHSCRLDLLEWTSPATVGEPYDTLLNAGIARIALVTTGIQQEYERLSAHGVEFLSPPTALAWPRVILACAQDPDGSILELMEFIKD